MQADQPIQASSEDRFGRSSFAQRIGQTIANRADAGSVVIGIHGAWGEGKTSVQNMIVEELNGHDNVVVRFNPWRFPDETQLLHRFFSTLAGTFDASLETRAEKLSATVNKYAEVLSPIPVGGKAASGFLKAFTSDRQADLEQLRTRIERILSDAGKRVAIFMDDIDRLDDSEVHAVFRLVKLSADFPNTAYILAFDEVRVAEALAKQYGSVEAGRNFLEKIVQVPLPLPISSINARRAIAVEGIEAALELAKIDVTGDQKRRFADVFDKAFLRRITTPRLAKRFANGLTFTLPIIAGEVDPIDAVLMEAIRIFYPLVYASIRDNHEVYLGEIFDAPGERIKKEAKDRLLTVIDKALAGLDEDDKQAAKLVIQELFPRTGVSGTYGPGGYGPEYIAIWAKSQRIASKDYFRRYFNYGVPSDDISDHELQQFIDHFNYLPQMGTLMTSELETLAANNRADVLIRKLRQHEDELSEVASASLAQAIAASGEILPTSHLTDRFFGLGAYAQATALIRHLLTAGDSAARRYQFSSCSLGCYPRGTHH
jgi:predicted KAP-like P-loop ATPase